uniref:Uncharacterized protein n=1 Tax=Tetranychus urticae TaxID=32264 RepID=T1KT71_TETUR
MPIENNEKLNVSVGVFQVGVLSLFEEVNGVIVPAKKPVAEMLKDFINFGNFEITVKIADSAVDQLSGNGNYAEIMSMMSRGELCCYFKEIDVTWLPLPMDTPNITGVFSQVAYEDEYRLASYYRPTTSISQDVIHTFTLFDPKIWFIALLLAYAIECLLNFKDTSFSNIVNLLISCTQRLPSLFFRQYFAKRSVVRSIQILGLLFLSIIFGASFNKDMIIVTSEETVNTLRDVVNQRKTPIFINGLSEHELFRLGVTKDFRDVFKLAMEKGSPDQFSASLELHLIRRVINLAHNLFRTDKSHILHWSDQTYHKVHQAYIITDSPFKVEVRKRLMHLTGRFQQSDFIDKIQSKGVIEVSKDLGVSLYEILLHLYKIVY